ncbi:MAG: hypothetical protein U1F25_00070 [Rubrivivax sp.]
MPSADPPHQLGTVDLEQHDGVQRLSHGLQHAAQGLGLRLVAREAIENESLLRIRFREPVADDAEDDLVDDQLPGVHGRLGPQAVLGTALHGRAQQVPGGDLRNPETLHQPLRLGTLAGARRAQQYDTHPFTVAAPGRRGQTPDPAHSFPPRQLGYPSAS